MVYCFYKDAVTYRSEILSESQTFSLKKMRLKISSAKWRPFCLGLNVLNILKCLLGDTEMTDKDIPWLNRKFDKHLAAPIPLPKFKREQM